MIEITIKKPLYGSFVYIREETLRMAQRRNGKLKVIIPKQGEAIIDVLEWIKTGKKMEKVFKRPNEPMVLWGNNLFKPEIPETIPQTKALF